MSAPSVEGSSVLPVGDNTYYFEEVEIDNESEVGFVYNEVPEEESGDSDDSEMDLRRTIQSVQLSQAEAVVPGAVTPIAPAPVIDDFFRNFLLNNQFHATLSTFQTEFYEASQRKAGKRIEIGAIPDVYRENQALGLELEQLRSDLHKAREQANVAKSTWDKLKKERDFHRLHHRRVVQEKNKLANDMKRLRKHYSSFEPTIKLLNDKYENTMKEKMMMKIERDKLVSQIEALQHQIKSLDAHESAEDVVHASKHIDTAPRKQPPLMTVHHAQDSLMHSEKQVNPFVDMHFESGNAHKFTLQKTFKGHTMAVSDVATHPHKPVIATVSDDRSWKLWSIPGGELILSGEGHRDWIAACDFHPNGNLLATASGDGTVKIWDFADSTCRSTLPDHSQAVWGCTFHNLGDFLVSCSIDHTAKVWDLNSERCRHTFRGHVDSVNFVTFQPFSNIVATASGDKTVSLWDLRSGLCTQTLFGHRNAVNHVAFRNQADMLVSSDADGAVKLWDIRAVNELLEIGPSAPNRSANQSYFDFSGTSVNTASADGTIRVHNALDGALLGTLAGHDDAVQCIAVDASGTTLVSGGSDCTFRVWSQ